MTYRADPTKEEIEAVLAGCDGVTPGPWTVYHDTCAACEKEGRAEYNISELPGGYHAMLSEQADAAHIARLSPEFVRGLATLALEALSSREAGWQGKETAPKDRTRILFFSPSPMEMNIAYWIGAPHNHFSIDGFRWVHKPTHWMLLPNPPDQGSKSP